MFSKIRIFERDLNFETLALCLRTRNKRERLKKGEKRTNGNSNLHFCLLTLFIVLSLAGSRGNTLCFAAHWDSRRPYLSGDITAPTSTPPLIHLYIQNPGGKCTLLTKQTRGIFVSNGIVPTEFINTIRPARNKPPINKNLTYLPSLKAMSLPRAPIRTPTLSSAGMGFMA